MTSWIVISPDVSKPYIKTFICKYVCKALCWRIHHPVCRVCKNSMLQKDDFFCHRTLLFSSSARNPLHGKNEAIWCRYLVFFTIISSASDYLSLVKKANFIWEPDADASGKRCCASDEAKKCLRNESRNSILISCDYPDLQVDHERKASCFSLQNRSMRSPCVVICNLAGWENNWTGFQRQFFSDLIPDRSPFVINIETAFQSHAVKFFDNGNRVHCYIVHSLRTWE